MVYNYSKRGGEGTLFMERVLLATFQKDITRHYELAQAHGVGLELQVYGYDLDLLDSGWRELLDREQKKLMNTISK